MTAASDQGGTEDSRSHCPGMAGAPDAKKDP